MIGEDVVGFNSELPFVVKHHHIYIITGCLIGGGVGHECPSAAEDPIHDLLLGDEQERFPA